MRGGDFQTFLEFHYSGGRRWRLHAAVGNYTYRTLYTIPTTRNCRRRPSLSSSHRSGCSPTSFCTGRFFFCSSRSDEMVEALATSFQNLYNKYTRSEKSEDGLQNGGRREVYIGPTNVVTGDQQDPFHRYRPKSRKTFVFNVKHLCQAKTTKWQIVGQSKLRPLVGQSCTVCMPARVSIFFFYVGIDFFPRPYIGETQ